jgi:endonuclease G, mitochondrial
MSDSSYRRETVYGTPAADQIIHNRHYVLGYSYYFRQAKWALEIVNDVEEVKRDDVFRVDYRVPAMFRDNDSDYEGTKDRRGVSYERGHLVNSKNHIESRLENSETFLMSNMSPQTKGLNNGKWKILEEAVRELNRRPDILETFVVSGPLFYFDQAVKEIPSSRANGVTIPIPNGFFKSILTENHKGRFKMWSFIMDNDKPIGDLSKFLVSTNRVERYCVFQSNAATYSSRMRPPIPV